MFRAFSLISDLILLISIVIQHNFIENPCTTDAGSLADNLFNKNFVALSEFIPFYCFL